MPNQQYGGIAWPSLPGPVKKPTAPAPGDPGFIGPVKPPGYQPPRYTPPANEQPGPGFIGPVKPPGWQPPQQRNVPISKPPRLARPAP